MLEYLYAQPVVTVKDVQGITKTSFQAANRLVARLAILGILQEITGHARNRRFRYAPYIALFHD